MLQYKKDKEKFVEVTFESEDFNTKFVIATIELDDYSRISLTEHELRGLKKILERNKELFE
jgi:hypothetical protein